MFQGAEYEKMKVRDLHVGFGARQLVTTPSDELAWIEQNYQPNLYRLEASVLCYTTPQNMVGSLLISLQQALIASVYHQHSFQMPERLGHPLEILTQIPLNWLDPVTEQAKPVLWIDDQPMSVDRVLVKYACGAKSGVVLDPPLAGLILKDLYEDHTTFVIDKVWGDYSLVRPDGTVMPYYKHEFVEHDTPPNLSQKILDRLWQIYAELVTEVPMASSLFFNLFEQEFHQKLDGETFHRTISLGEV